VWYKKLEKYEDIKLMYRETQQVRPIFWEAILSVIVRKKVHMNMSLILNGYRDIAV
jgi:hypothetical protein